MRSNMKFIYLIILLTSTLVHAYGQYPPPAGQPGTTAIYKDSSAFYAWATHCTVRRGFVTIADTNFTYNGSNRASYGDDSMATGIADNEVVSLGDGGMATLTFDTVISDHDGWDFAVFENGFGHGFLELAFVEVSSDGSHFVRFPSISLTQTLKQDSTFDTLDTRKIYNLAGKYRGLYGTPFDLSQLKDSVGIDIHSITTIRVIDVVGCLQDAYAQYDSQNHKINDPWPTPFNTGGFDLDAVGLVHHAPTSIDDKLQLPQVSILPNPCSTVARFFAGTSALLHYEIRGETGQMLISSSFSVSTVVDISALPAGMYFVTFTNPVSALQLTKKLMKY